MNRAQFVLRPMDIEEFIGEDHPARALWEFVGHLDLTKFHEPLKAVEGRAGQPGNDPRLMIALWLYAYSRGIGSAREVARQCEYEPGFQWLCALDPVNHHSLSDFHVDFNEALTELFTQVLGVLSAEGLIALERVAHDGTRIRAAASANTFRSEKTLREHLELARKQVKEMGDPAQPPASPRKTGAQKRARREREEKLVAALEQLEQVRKDRRNQNRREARASETDPEARVMKRSGGGFEPSYNVQISTDATAGLIVGLHVTQSGGDAPHLQPAIERIEKTFGKVPGQVLADGGYTSSENILALHGRTDFIGPLQVANEARLEGQRKRTGIAAEFTADRFVFVEELNSFRCPAGQLLVYYKVEKRPRKTRALPPAPARSYTVPITAATASSGHQRVAANPVFSMARIQARRRATLGAPLNPAKSARSPQVTGRSSKRSGVRSRMATAPAGSPPLTATALTSFLLKFTVWPSHTGLLPTTRLTWNWPSEKTALGNS